MEAADWRFYWLPCLKCSQLEGGETTPSLRPTSGVGVEQKFVQNLEKYHASCCHQDESTNERKLCAYKNKNKCALFSQHW